MAITIPGTAVNYPVALLAIGLKNSCVPVGQNPVNGPQCIAAEADWGTMGGTDKIVGFNIGNAGGTRAFQDLCALLVDNSQCGADVEFVFTDTQFSYTVPAYAPYALIPIFTKALQFYCVTKIDGEVVEASDITRFLMFNFVPPPVVVPTSEEQSVSGGVGLVLANPAPAPAQIIPAGVNGTVEAFSVQALIGTAVTGSATVQLLDGNNAVVWGGNMAGAMTGAPQNVLLANANNVHIRFANGLKLVVGVSTLDATSSLEVNVYYRKP